jgi:hypothetical protein
MLDVTIMTVGRYIKKGLLPGTERTDPIGKKSPYRIPRRSVERLMKLRVVSPELEDEPEMAYTGEERRQTPERRSA